MTCLRRTTTAILTCLLALALAMADMTASDPLPGATAALADDDGGGRGGGRGNRSAKRGGDDGPTLLRPWRKRKATVRRARPAIVQAQFEPNTLIARDLSEATLAALGQRGYRVVERHALTGGRVLVKLAVPRGTSLEAARGEVRATEPAALVDFNHYYRPDSDRCTGGRCLMRHVAGWPADMSAATCRPGAPIGLIDTRINLDHPALKDTSITVLPLFEDGAAASGAHHGTAVAALFVGHGAVPGLLQGWELVAIDAFRKGDIATGMDLARAIDMLAARDIPVINMSLSGPDNAVLGATVADVIAMGVVVIAAAGNDGPRAKPAYPAAYPDVIAVTAVDRGKRIYRRAAQGDHIDIAAPGVGVWTAASIKGQRPRSGTSFAAPFVAAAAAMIMAENPGFSRKEIEIVLANEADDLGAEGRDSIYGWGLLDMSSICRD